jgi:exodeoxyribonuclease VII small subunit
LTACASVAVQATLLLAGFVDRNPLIELNFPFYRSGGHRVMPTSPKPQNSQTFESALAELEKIVAGMEAGQMPLEKSLAAYRRGAELLKFCQAALQDAQQQVKILEGDILQDFKSDN